MTTTMSDTEAMVQECLAELIGEAPRRNAYKQESNTPVQSSNSLSPLEDERREALRRKEEYEMALERQAHEMSIACLEEVFDSWSTKQR